MAKTIKGLYCSPASDKGNGRSGSSCYTRDQLVQLATAYNNKYSSGSQINIRGNKEQLWQELENRMVQQCDTEWCWMDALGQKEFDNTFRPIRPVGKYQWLSTSDIRYVLKQYEEAYPEFIFLGPVSIDFCNLADNAVCNINLKSSKRNGKTKIGIVFNTDPSTEPGKHWISMFIDISDPDPSKHEIGYFDSYGMAPLLPEIRTLIGNLRAQNPQIQLKLNCNDQFCTQSVRHQRNNSECGMYSINFIAVRLTGQSWEDIVVHGRWTDEQMVERRKYYFRPTVGGYHRD
jgi:hypothetical protein